MNWYDYPIQQQYNPSKGEYGVDIGTPYGTPITSLFGGQVIEAQRTDWGGGLSSGGIVTILSNVPGIGQVLTYYLHLDALNPGIGPGSYIAPGTVLGTSGGQTSGGNWPTSPKYSSGPHTEFGFAAPFAGTGVGTGKGKNVDPLPFLESLFHVPAPGTTGTPISSTGSPKSGAGIDFGSIFGSIGASVQDLVTRGFLIALGVLLGVVALLIMFRKQEKVVIQEGAKAGETAALAA